MKSTSTRRRFLANATRTGIALAGASAFGFTPLRAVRGADAPSNRVRLGIMGTNGRGNDLAGAFARLPGAEMVYVCDVDSRAVDKTKKMLEDRGVSAQGVGDFRKILDDKTIDGLVVAAPDHWHGPATIIACNAGKHVYVEKPACHNGHEGQLMIQASRKHKRVVQMGSQRRSAPGIIELIKRLHEGVIGDILMARGWINSTRPSIGQGKPAPVPTHLDYTLWQGPAPETPFRDNVIHYHWHWFWVWGTGELGNNGIHALDICRWGLNVDYPKRVVCGGGKYHFKDDQETPDTQIATFDFGDKVINWEHRTWHRHGFEGMMYGCVFYGEKGTIVLGNNEYTVLDPKGKEIDRKPVQGGQTEHLTDFLSCVRDGNRPRADIEDGVASTALCNLGNIAYRSGRTVNFDPKNRTVIGDQEQAQLWTREYRPGWEPKI